MIHLNFCFFFCPSSNWSSREISWSSTKRGSPCNWRKSDFWQSSCWKMAGKSKHQKASTPFSVQIWNNIHRHAVTPLCRQATVKKVIWLLLSKNIKYGWPKCRFKNLYYQNFYLFVVVIWHFLKSPEVRKNLHKLNGIICNLFYSVCNAAFG